MLEGNTTSLNRNSEHIVYIDVARGIAAFLVVVGHSIQVADATFDQNIFFRLIYSFHMPLFMFLSGYVSYKSDVYEYRWIINKAKHLAIPFFIWTILPVLFSGNTRELLGRLHEVLRQPDLSFWFLIILFYCDVLLFIQNKIEQVFNVDTKELGVLLTVGIVLLVKLTTSIYAGYGLALLSWHSVFFFAGYWTRRLSVSVKVQKIVFIFFAFIWIPLVGSWSRIKLPDYILQLAAYINQSQFERVASVYNYMVAFAGIGFAILTAMLLGRLRSCEKALSEMGIHTIELYLLQNLFYNLIKTPYMWLNILCNIVLGLTIPLLICYLMKQGKMSMIFFGKKV